MFVWQNVARRQAWYVCLALTLTVYRMSSWDCNPNPSPYHNPNFIPNSNATTVGITRLVKRKEKSTAWDAVVMLQDCGVIILRIRRGVRTEENVRIIFRVNTSSAHARRVLPDSSVNTVSVSRRDHITPSSSSSSFSKRHVTAFCTRNPRGHIWYVMSVWRKGNIA